MKSFSLRDVRMLVRLALGSYPFSYPLLGFAPAKLGFVPNKIKMIHSKTDLCIDGFPHSGNTFFTRLVSHWNPELNIARHMHVPFQIISAAKKKIPTLVLIREPGQALASILHKYPDLNPCTACLYYDVFYKKIMPWQKNIIVVDFDRMVKNPVLFLKSANAKFNCFLHYGKYSAEVEELIIKKIPGKVEKKKTSSIVRRRELIEKQLRSMKSFEKAYILYRKYTGP